MLLQIIKVRFGKNEKVKKWMGGLNKINKVEVIWMLFVFVLTDNVTLTQKNRVFQ